VPAAVGVVQVGVDALGAAALAIANRLGRRELAFFAAPTLLLALAVFLRGPVAGPRQVGEVLVPGACELALGASGLG
jgi:hypothetical protein